VNGSPALDALIAAAGIDPGAGLQVVDAARIAAVAFDPSLPLVVLPVPASASPDATLPGRHARRSPLAVVNALYPPDHRLRSLPDGRETSLAEMSEEALVAGAWLVPPLSVVDNLASPHGMAAISARLRAADGCPWDRRQDHRSLRPYLLEEAYETLDAIERGVPADLAEELGDLYLQVVLHAQFAAEAGQFDLTDVYRAIAAKIVRRHPHVFGDVTVSGVEQVATNWEAIKAGERSEAGREPSAFAGVARALPALPASREIQERAASLGWDWPAIDGVWEKVAEELDELRAVAGTSASAGQRLHEVGDVLFALVNIARWLKVDPEEALRAANRRWIARYEAVEVLAAERGLDLAALDADGRDRLWDEVKAG
jgi:tetrapyrrole methylase family protein / MazG family protein